MSWARVADALTALDFPYYFSEEGPDWMELRDVLIFVEDTHIRALDPSERQFLHTTSESDFFHSFRQYLAALPPCLKVAAVVVSLLDGKNALTATTAPPVSLVVDALLGVATRLYYFQSTEAINASHNKWVSDHGRRLVSTFEPPSAAEPTAATPAEDEAQLKQALQPLAVLLDLPRDTANDVVYFEVLRLLKGLSGKKSATEKQKADLVELFNSIPVKDYAPHLASDAALARALRVMRLMFTQDISALQGAISQSISDLQDLTANPKIDPRLGRVGS